MPRAAITGIRSRCAPAWRREEGHGSICSIGGKSGVASGDPIDLAITVKGLADSVTQRFGEAPVNMGATAWVAAEGIDLVLTSLRTQVFHPEGMTKLGLDLASRKMVLVKSTQHFHAGFAPIAKAILYAAPPGALRPISRRSPTAS